jgi:hypothetical protein
MLLNAAPHSYTFMRVLPTLTEHTTLCHPAMSLDFDDNDAIKDFILSIPFNCLDKVSLSHDLPTFTTFTYATARFTSAPVNIPTTNLLTVPTKSSGLSLLENRSVLQRSAGLLPFRNLNPFGKTLRKALGWRVRRTAFWPQD